MKKIIPFVAIVILILSSFSASASCRTLTRAEAVKLNSSACQYFERIYGNRVSIDIKSCAARSSFSVCENDPQHGTYIYGKLVATKRTFDCNMSIVNRKIAGADCGDE